MACERRTAYSAKVCTICSGFRKYYLTLIHFKLYVSDTSSLAIPSSFELFIHRVCDEEVPMLRFGGVSVIFRWSTVVAHSSPVPSSPQSNWLGPTWSQLENNCWHESLRGGVVAVRAVTITSCHFILSLALQSSPSVFTVQCLHMKLAICNSDKCLIDVACLGEYRDLNKDIGQCAMFYSI